MRLLNIPWMDYRCPIDTFSHFLRSISWRHSEGLSSSFNAEAACDLMFDFSLRDDFTSASKIPGYKKLFGGLLGLTSPFPPLVNSTLICYTIFLYSYTCRWSVLLACYNCSTLAISIDWLFILFFLSFLYPSLFLGYAYERTGIKDGNFSDIFRRRPVMNFEAA